MYFPHNYDLRYIAFQVEKSNPRYLDYRGGLSNLAETLGIPRQGIAHQAGSDSYVTGKIFFEFKTKVFADKNIEKDFNNVIYGIGLSKCEEAYMDEY